MAYNITPLISTKKQPTTVLDPFIPKAMTKGAVNGALAGATGRSVVNAQNGITAGANMAVNGSPVSSVARGAVAGAGNAVNGNAANNAYNAVANGALAGANMATIGSGNVANGVNGVINGAVTGAINGANGGNVPSGSPNNGGGGSGAGASGYQSAPVVDPYASVYALYDDLLNSQRDALAQERDARLRGLQANYQNAKSRLDSSFNSGETELNQNADRALREAFIEDMLNRRALNQQLAANGIIGGAAESVLARAFNNYGNNRNEIERGRMDDLRSLLANYQNTAGDIENAYLQGMSNADADYAGSIGQAMQNYYNKLIDMQQQNIANQYRNQQLSRSSSSRSSSANDNLTSNGLNKKTIVSTMGKFADDPESLAQYSASLGLGADELNDLYRQAGVNPSTVGAPANPTQNPVQRANILASVPLAVRQRLLSYLDNSRGQVYGDDSRLMAALQTYGRQNGLSEEQVRAILAEAGY